MRVNAVDFSPDGHVLAAACGDGTAGLWDVSSGERIRLIIATTNTACPLVSVAFSADWAHSLPRRAPLQGSRFGTPKQGGGGRSRPGSARRPPRLWQPHPWTRRSRGARSAG